MIEEYSIMDWMTFSGIVATIASLVGIAIKLARDNSGLKAEMKALSKEREMENIIAYLVSIEAYLVSIGAYLKNMIAYLKSMLLLKKIQNIFQMK